MFKKIIIFSILIMGLTFSFFHFFKNEIVKASSTNTVFGWAWSENIGWISLNCNNSELPEPRCVRNYGINIRNDGTFEGYAWSENIGWINFAPIGPFPALPDHSARVDLVTGEVSGWARVLAYDGGWDGWIKLRGTNYGISINTTSGEFNGFAWSNMVIGWIRFNGARTNSNLFNRRPSATTLNIHQQNYCLNVNPIASLSWIFTDFDINDTQLAFQIQIDNNSDFLSPIDTGKIESDSQVYHTIPGQLSYGNTYHWRLKVWDSRNAESVWIAGSSFTTPEHAYPVIDFRWIPFNPHVGEIVYFIDRSRVFGGTEKYFSWTFQNGVPSTSNISNPILIFTSNGPKNVTLRITGPSGFSCERESTINVRPPLPKWREVDPFGFIENIFTRIFNWRVAELKSVL